LRLWCVALGDHVVDDAHHKDQSKGEFIDGDSTDKAADGDVRERAHGRVLGADRGVAGPEEVDLHRNAPDQSEDVDDEAPLAELERGRLLWPAAEPGDEDGEVAEDV